MERAGDIAGTLPVGRVLDLGCGEGGDAVWLAERGWRVTAGLDTGRWRAERLDAPERQAVGPNGESATVTDNVIAVRRGPLPSS